MKAKDLEKATTRLLFLLHAHDDVLVLLRSILSVPQLLYSTVYAQLVVLDALVGVAEFDQF